MFTVLLFLVIPVCELIFSRPSAFSAWAASPGRGTEAAMGAYAPYSFPWEQGRYRAEDSS